MLALSLHVGSKSIAAGQRLVEFSDFSSGMDEEESELFDFYSQLRLTNVCTMVGRRQGKLRQVDRRKLQWENGLKGLSRFLGEF